MVIYSWSLRGYFIKSVFGEDVGILVEEGGD